MKRPKWVWWFTWASIHSSVPHFWGKSADKPSTGSTCSWKSIVTWQFSGHAQHVQNINFKGILCKKKCEYDLWLFYRIVCFLVCGKPMVIFPIASLPLWCYQFGETDYSCSLGKLDKQATFVTKPLLLLVTPHHFQKMHSPIFSATSPGLLDSLQGIQPTTIGV